MPEVIIFHLSLAVLLGIILSIFLAGSISKPLRQVTRAMDKIREGDLEVTIPVLSNDEIGFMSEGLNRMVDGLKERRFIRETFGSYLSPDVVDEILKSPEVNILGGQTLKITVLVSDLTGFTRLSASVAPETVVRIVNLYFERMVEIIMVHEGTIDEFTGDGILAFFGAPRKMPNSELTAVKCALAMQEAMTELNHDFENIINAREASYGRDLCDSQAEVKSEDFEPITMKIAINSGDLIVGNIGCTKRRKYGAVGTPINIAFRMEKQAKGGEIVVSSEVYDKVRHVVNLDSYAKVSLKGVDEPVLLYRVSNSIVRCRS